MNATHPWPQMRPHQQVEAVIKTWRERYIDEWRDHGLGYTAPEYARTVAQFRLGLRGGLNFPNGLSYGPVRERDARAKLRGEVDTIIAELKGA